MNIAQEKHTEIDGDKQGEIKHRVFESKNHKFVLLTLILTIPYSAFATYVIITHDVHLFNFDGVIIPVWQSILLAIGAFILLFLMPLLSMNTVDELETHINMKACALGILSTVAIYPVWRLLSLSEIVTAPTADQAFLLMVLSVMTSYIIIKIKS